MRVAVMGAGGTGGYFGGLLARAGEDVTFIARGVHLEAIRSRGLSVKSRLAGDFTIPVKATSDPSEVGSVELVLFCVKAYDTAAAAEQIRPLMGPDTLILSVQNGIDNAERIAEVVGPDHVVGGVAQVSSVIESPGVIAQTAGPGRILFGELAGGTSARANRLLQTFEQAGVPAVLRQDIRVALWEKFLFICAFSGLTTLTRLPIGPIVACAETSAMLRQVMEEVEAVARASGVALRAECVDRAFAAFTALEPWARGSLYHDLAAGRRLELDTLNGTIVRLGRELGVPTPMNSAIYGALKPYADGAPVLP